MDIMDTVVFMVVVMVVVMVRSVVVDDRTEMPPQK